MRDTIVPAKELVSFYRHLQAKGWQGRIGTREAAQQSLERTWLLGVAPEIVSSQKAEIDLAVAKLEPNFGGIYD